MQTETVGNYRLVKHLATGQTSQVYEVVESGSSRHLAMKLLLPEKVGDVQARGLLLHEAEVGLKLAHPNIIRIFHVNKSKENPFFVMEYFQAGSIRLRLQRKEKTYFVEKGQELLKQAATGLAFMHSEGWVHRDIKPDNILVNNAGEVKLIDFAIACRIPSGLAKLLGRNPKAAGTRSYMSPEQIRGQHIDGRADIYSFGCMCYEIGTLGKVPFTGNSNQDLLTRQIRDKPISPEIQNPEITKEFAGLVMRMLEKKPENRPKDFHEVLIALRSLQIWKSPQPGK
ncbi:MAG: serine/threonine protein kinase [Gemmataceae bacterium]